MGKIKDHHNLVCYWCDVENKKENVDEMFRAFKVDFVHWSCDHCGRRSRVYKTKLGFYSMTPADRARYIRNVAKGTERLITLSDKELKTKR